MSPARGNVGAANTTRRRLSNPSEYFVTFLTDKDRALVYKADNSDGRVIPAEVDQMTGREIRETVARIEDEFARLNAYEALLADAKRKIKQAVLFVGSE